MFFNNVFDLVDKLFYKRYDNVIIVNIDKRETYNMEDLSLKELTQYLVKDIIGIIIDENGKIRIQF